jgi:hypothetical protein
MREFHTVIKREARRAMADAARAAQLPINAEGIALAMGPEFLIVNAPIAGIEKLDLRPMLEGQSVLNETPVMYWYIGGEVLADGGAALSEGYYTVLADQASARVSLRNDQGEAILQGDLVVTIEPQPVALKFSFPGGSAEITKLDVGKKHFKMCGNASIGAFGGKVQIEGCIDVSW